MPSVAYVLKDDTFKTWRERTNSIIDELDNRLVASNNLSDVTDPDAAASNIGAATEGFSIAMAIALGG